MIIGVGLDMVEIERVRRLIAADSGPRFLERVLTKAEREQGFGKKGRFPEYVAGRFAAKEAIVKALGCGIGKEVGFQDVEVLPDEKGRPECTISETAMKRLGYRQGEVRIHVSITHTDKTAAAYATAERVTSESRPS